MFQRVSRAPRIISEKSNFVDKKAELNEDGKDLICEKGARF